MLVSPATVFLSPVARVFKVNIQVALERLQVEFFRQESNKLGWQEKEGIECSVLPQGLNSHAHVNGERFWRRQVSKSNSFFVQCCSKFLEIPALSDQACRQLDDTNFFQTAFRDYICQLGGFAPFKMGLTAMTHKIQSVMLSEMRQRAKTVLHCIPQILGRKLIGLSTCRTQIEPVITRRLAGIGKASGCLVNHEVCVAGYDGALPEFNKTRMKCLGLFGTWTQAMEYTLGDQMHRIGNFAPVLVRRFAGVAGRCASPCEGTADLKTVGWSTIHLVKCRVQNIVE
ncbi:MAG TPA: hypothetical protein VFV28_08615 [Limnobacter sp.]|nr:hypothetical protein [Limnobacter sp.]